jgi:hypothetical protein
VESAYALPRSLHFAAGAPKCGAEEKAGRSGRDDKKEKKRTQEGWLESQRYI